MSQQGPQVQQVPQTVIQKVGVPTASTMDQSMLEYLNDIEPFTPKPVMEVFWGYANHMTGLTIMTDKEARAMILGARNLVEMAIMARPSWEAADPHVIMTYDNFLNLVKIQVRKSRVVTPGTNVLGHIAAMSSINDNRAPDHQRERRKFLGVF